jgi:hypothetical protein
VFLRHLIEFPFLKLCLGFDPIYFLLINIAHEKKNTIAFTCSGVIPGDVGCRDIWAGGVVALSLAIVVDGDGDCHRVISSFGQCYIHIYPDSG